jgi:adenylate cyclase
MKISIRSLLLFPFLVQLFTVVVFMGFVSQRNAQRTAEVLVEKLRTEASERVRQRVKLYLTTPHLVNQLNVRAYQSGLLDIDNTQNLETYFWNQLSSFHLADISNTAQPDLAQNELNESVNNIYIGRPSGHLYGAEHESAEGRLYIMRADETTENFLNLYVPDANGRATQERKERKPTAQVYNATGRPWYQKAVEQGGGATWSEIYGDFSTGGERVITAATPVFENGEVIGVFASDLLLLEVSQFLGSINISENGTVFILDRAGQLISTPLEDEADSEEISESSSAEAATPEAPSDNTPSTSSDPDSMPTAGESGNTLIDAVPNCLAQAGHTFAQMSGTVSFACNVNDKYFLEASVIEDDYGLSWLMFVAIPEADLLGEIRENNRQALLAFLVALGLGTILSVFTARKLAEPVLQLKESATQLSESLDQDLSIPEIQNPSELGALAETFSKMSDRLRQSFERMAALNAAYSRFVPNRFVELLEKEITEVQLGDYSEQTNMSILFSDIRSFTALSESMSPQENFAFINAYLKRMEPLITGNHGFIDKYIGDGIMAIFPSSSPESPSLEESSSLSPAGEIGEGSSADHAVQAALKMLDCLKEYNTTRTTQDRQPIYIGIGINTGPMMLGTVGGEGRMDGTVISDNVNVAARIEGLTKEYQASLIVSEETLNSLTHPNQYPSEFLGEVKVKGRQQPVRIYKIAHPIDEELELPEIEVSMDTGSSEVDSTIAQF